MPINLRRPLIANTHDRLSGFCFDMREKRSVTCACSAQHYPTPFGLSVVKEAICPTAVCPYASSVGRVNLRMLQSPQTSLPRPPSREPAHHQLDSGGALRKFPSESCLGVLHTRTKEPTLAADSSLHNTNEPLAACLTSTCQQA